MFIYFLCLVFATIVTMARKINKSSITLIAAISSLSAMIGIGTIMFRHLENWTYAESFYFSVVSLTTVGYGDIHPSTDETRVIAAVYILIGVAIVLAALTRIGSSFIVSREEKIAAQIKRSSERRKK